MPVTRRRSCGKPDGTIIELTTARLAVGTSRPRSPPSPTATIDFRRIAPRALYRRTLLRRRTIAQGEQRLLTALGDSAVRESSNVAQAIQNQCYTSVRATTSRFWLSRVETVADAVQRRKIG